MKNLCIFLFICVSLGVLPVLAASPGESTNLTLSRNFGNIPLYFIANKGQVNEQALFYSKTSKYTLWLTKQGLVFDTRTRGKNRDVSQLVFLNTAEHVQAVSGKTSNHKVNYFKGRDKRAWHTGIPTSESVVYKTLYPNIDLKVYGVEKEIEYDWVIHPGGKPGDISFTYKGINGSRIDKEGNLIIQTEAGQWVHKKPVAYQVMSLDRGGEQTKMVTAQFKKLSKNRYGFDVGRYDRRYPLVIDPLILSMFTYLGGSGDEDFQDIAVDATGIYITGVTDSLDYPLLNAAQTSLVGVRDVVVSKLTLDGSALIYSTYLGGNSEDNTAALALDASGSVVVVGLTESTDFPTVNPYQGSLNGTVWDGFIARLSADGSTLLYSTYLGGMGLDYVMDVQLGSGGEIYVTGSTQSSDFPVANAFQPTYAGGEGDAFLTKLTAAGDSLIFSTFLGGSRTDFPHGLELDASGNIYVGGSTSSYDYPVLNAYQSVKLGDQYSDSGFITKLSPDGSGLVFSTYLGGSKYDYLYDIALDASGAVYACGTTESTDFPVTPGAYQQNKLGNPYMPEGFVSKLAADGSSLVYSTYLSGPDFGEFIMLAPMADGSVYVTGYSASMEYPQVNSFIPEFWDTAGGLVSRLSADGSSLLHSTFLKPGGCGNGFGIALDANGAVYVTGMTGDSYSGYQGYQDVFGGGGLDGFIAKLEDTGIMAITVTYPNTAVVWEIGSQQTITWTAPSTVKTVDIRLYPDGQTEVTIAEDAPNTGSFQWTVTDHPSTSCFLMVGDGSMGGWLGDDADEFFTITPPLPSIEVTAPNGGETLIMKHPYTITWNSVNLPTGFVNIYYSTNTGGDWTQIGGGPVANTGSYNWIVPIVFSDQCLVKVEDEYQSIWDESNGVFTIKSSTISEAERTALILLYNDTNGDNWNDNSNWRKPGYPTQFNDPGTEGAWFGVTLTSDNQHVEKLELDWNNLVGPLPPELNDLTYLRILQMEVNQLTGPLPDLSNLSQLIWLRFYANQLSGPVPAWINNLTSLQRIILRNNQFTGTIPDLSNLNQLIMLNLGWNQLSGPVPSWLNSKTAIYSLDLEFNYLSGELPDLSGMIGLRFLYLRNNELSGVIPAWFNTMTPLETFRLGNNQFTGTIPDLSALTSVVSFELQSNQLTGPMPAWLDNLTALQRLDLSNNQLSGTIPSLASIASMRYLYLNNNQFSGNIPADIGSMTTLYYLWLHGNKLVGEAPSSLINLTNLYPALNNGLDISYNGFYTSDDALRNFMNTKHTGYMWENTQTVAPKALAVDSVTHNSITLTWWPIQYTGDTGRFKVFYSPSAGGGYTLAGTTADKTETTFTINGLSPETAYYFKVQTVTDVHANNQNAVVSEETPYVSGTTLVQPSLTMVYPAPGEDVAAGSVYSIKWSTTGTVANVDLEFSSDNGVNWQPLVISYANTGLYDWTVPDMDSGLCLLRISDSAGVALPDVTDGVFGIWRDPSITVVSPNGGEVWTGGNVYPITWNSTGKIVDVTIEYTVTDGRTWLLLESAAANTGVYQWTVPAQNKNKCKVRITGNGAGVQDVSDGLFSIRQK
jgi:Leucine-rich repeat (LRR) protein